MATSIEDIKKFYDKATYRKLHGFIYSNERVERAWEVLLALSASNGVKKILEIGCGIGEISYRLAEKLPHASVTGFDISEKSIEFAQTLFVKNNLSYISADDITHVNIEKDTKFEIIFLMDVYEHIPLTSRAGLHQFIAQHISPSGLVFLSCPTPQHLDFLRKNKPTEIQPVDEDIRLDELLQLQHDTGLRMSYYKEISVWSAGDYFHAAFSNALDLKPFSDKAIVKRTPPVSLKSEVKKKLKAVLKKKQRSRAPGSDEKESRRAVIRNVLGKEYLDMIESFEN